MKQLEKLAKRKPPYPIILLEVYHTVVNPLVWQALDRLLQAYPDEMYFYQYIVTWLRSGFRGGFQYDSVSRKSVKSSMMLAMKNPQVVDGSSLMHHTILQ